MVEQSLLKLPHAKEVIAFAELFDWPLTVGAETVVHVLLRPEAFVERAIPAGIVRTIDELRVVQFLQQSLDHGLMLGIRGANEPIVGNGELLPKGLKLWRQLVAMRLWRNPGFCRGLLDFLAVFVEARQKKDFFPNEAMPACQDVRRDGGISMPDVWNVVHIVNGRGDIEGFRHRHLHFIPVGVQSFVGHFRCLLLSFLRKQESSVVILANGGKAKTLDPLLDWIPD